MTVTVTFVASLVHPVPATPPGSSVPSDAVSSESQGSVPRFGGGGVRWEVLL